MFDSAHQALHALAARALDRGRYAPDELVVGTSRGTPQNGSNWNHRVWKPALKQAGLLEHGYRWHDLRHTATSALYGQGADIVLVDAFGGWASSATTLKVYAHLTRKRIETAALKFDPMRELLANR